ncbi:unnamed protein product [Phytophthora fragariaefolia]|uniref:Unnamed protein product n=1 Tax=Phytophthora fragariaefolia TaxID=1490495 RepID=A0A9W6TYL5_9STRA|nr:unnamed protein product [Phytophthora fragariaefolia]
MRILSKIIGPDALQGDNARQGGAAAAAQHARAVHGGGRRSAQVQRRVLVRGLHCRSLSRRSPCLNVPFVVSCASDWWAPKSTTGVGPLHQINPVRVKYIRSYVIEHFGHTSDDDPTPLRGLRVADVGCGGGILSEALCRIGGTMVSVDPGEDNIAAAKKHAALSRHTSSIDYRRCSSGEIERSFGS